MKPIRLTLPILLFFAVFFTACKKSSSDKAKTKTELLAQASWKFDNAKVGGTDVSGLLKSCETDNVLVFASAGTGSVDEGATKCNAGDPQTNSFTWSLATGDTVLHVSTILFTGGSSDFTLVTLDDTQLVLSQVIMVSGVSQTAVVTFKH